MNITVFGLGFVGLTTALGLAQKGHKVYGIDVDQERYHTIADGCLPFLEPGLDIALTKELGKRLVLSDSAEEAVSNSQCVFFCVGTPYGDNGKADLSYLYSAVDMALKGVSTDQFRVFVVKSTVPPSTVQERLVPYLKAHTPLYGQYLGVANNPEFLREGHCWEDFLYADRIVIGVNESKSEQLLRELYRDFDCPVIAVTPNTGEFIKYLSNSLLATLISYSNEMSLLADAIGEIEVAKAFRILHMDKRWGGCDMTSYVYPGCGYGGYCLPKDTKALYAQACEKGFRPEILEHVIQLNDQMPWHVAQRIMQKTKPSDRIAVLGLSFKQGSDDVRQSPAAPILSCLQAQGYYNIVAYDPVANILFRQSYPNIELEYAQTLPDALQKIDYAVILTAWEEFSNLRQLTEAPIIDCRYMLK